MADLITGTGRLSAVGGSGRYYSGTNYSGGGGAGRIRVEANSITLQDAGTPRFTVGLPGSPAKLWPSEFAPVIRIISLDGHEVSISPKRGLNLPDQEVIMNEPGLVPLIIQAFNVPSTATMLVKIVRKTGPDTQHVATLIEGETDLWRAMVQVASEISAIQVRATLP